MDNDNKNRLVEGAKKLALIVYGVLTIGVCAGVWNYCPEPFVKVLAGVLFLADGYLIYRFAKKIHESNL